MLSQCAEHAAYGADLPRWRSELRVVSMPMSRATRRWCSVSAAEPAAISRKRIVSTRELLPQPSAMLAAIDSAERRSCDVISRSSGLLALAVSR